MDSNPAETVFVDDGYPEADEFSNNYRERESRVHRRALPSTLPERRNAVVRVVRQLFGFDRA